MLSLLQNKKPRYPTEEPSICIFILEMSLSYGAYKKMVHCWTGPMDWLRGSHRGFLRLKRCIARQRITIPRANYGVILTNVLRRSKDMQCASKCERYFRRCARK